MKLNSDKLYFLEISISIILLLQTVVISQKLDAKISLKVEGNGFHRLLIYHVNFNNELEKCYATIYLTLPQALYVNVNELTDLTRLGITTACSVGETDIEQFAENAESQNVTICSPLTGMISVLKLPVHQRYQYPSESDLHTNIILPKPKLLLGCKERVKEYRISKIDLCLPCAELVSKWREIPFIMGKEDFVWTVPIGNSTMCTVVTYVTLLVTVLCTAFLAWTVSKSVPKEHEKKE